jgi:hypothetical protein
MAAPTIRWILLMALGEDRNSKARATTPAKQNGRRPPGRLDRASHQPQFFEMTTAPLRVCRGNEGAAC